MIQALWHVALGFGLALLLTWNFANEDDDEDRARFQHPSRPKLHPHYTSTYCIHELHDNCRLRCKTCMAPCRCTCHPESRRVSPPQPEVKL